MFPSDSTSNPPSCILHPINLSDKHSRPQHQLHVPNPTNPRHQKPTNQPLRSPVSGIQPTARTQLTTNPSAVEDHGSGWSSLWDTGNSNLWDRGKPSPALIDLIEDPQHQDLLYPLTADGRRKRALVPVRGFHATAYYYVIVGRRLI